MNTHMLAHVRTAHMQHIFTHFLREPEVCTEMPKSMASAFSKWLTLELAQGSHRVSLELCAAKEESVENSAGEFHKDAV